MSHLVCAAAGSASSEAERGGEGGNRFMSRLLERGRDALRRDRHADRGPRRFTTIPPGVAAASAIRTPHACARRSRRAPHRVPAHAAYNGAPAGAHRSVRIAADDRSPFRTVRRLAILDRPRRHVHRHRRPPARRHAGRRTSCCRKTPSATATPRCRASANCSGCAPARRFPRGAIDAVKMGTTVATNALLERKGERTVLRHHAAASPTRCASPTRTGRSSSCAGSSCRRCSTSA